ncbi:MAG: hypothetical protein IPL61_11395 [Myxococcales bacterium]|nr:hypothetical protein [Myxococcales bacterium]
MIYIALTRLRASLWRARRLDRGHFVAWSLAIAAVEVLFTWAIGSVVVGLVWIGAPIVALVLAALMAWLVVPHWLIEGIAIPRGWPRVAWYLSATDPRGDGDAGRAIVTARAIVRAGAPAPAVAWLAARLPARLDARGVVAHGLIAHGRGARDDARRLLRSVAELGDPSAAPRDAAGEWLAVDAAERGAWLELAVDATSAAWPATPLRILLEGVALRAVGSAAGPSVVGLWLRWLVAPARRATWALVRRPPAVTSPSARATTATVDASDNGAPVDAHGAALAAYGRALGQRSPAACSAAVTAWSAVLDAPTWLDDQAARAIALGLDPTSARATAAAARDQLTGHLVELVLATGAPLPVADGGLAAAVRTVARGRLLAGLELTFGRLRGRVGATEALAAIDEWREFLALRDAYLTAVAPGGVELERVAYPHADNALGDFTVWLWNKRGEHVISHAITSWLYARAAVVGDAAAVELHGRNRALTVPAA